MVEDRPPLETEADEDGAPESEVGGLSDDESGWVDLGEDPFTEQPAPGATRAWGATRVPWPPSGKESRAR